MGVSVPTSLMELAPCAGVRPPLPRREMEFAGENRENCFALSLLYDKLPALTNSISRSGF